MQTKEIIISI